MGDTRGTRSRVAALVVVLAAGLLTAVTSAPARAAGPFPPSCVAVYGGETVQFDHYPAAYIADLDVELPWGYEESQAREIALVNGESWTDQGVQTVLTDAGGKLESSRGIRKVVFDDEATLGYWDEPPFGASEVRVRPRQGLPTPRESFERTWWVRIQADNRPPFPANVFTATVTYSDCDADSDYHGDKTEDNCVGLANPDQRDLDRDAIGDACDPDDDNDGIADAGDNCPLVANADQVDWDRDRVGNACGTTPGSAPVTPAPTTPAPTTVPPTPTTTSTPPTGTVTGCSSSCTYVRTVGMRHRASKHRLVGTVESVATGCYDGVPVTIWRKPPVRTASSSW